MNSQQGFSSPGKFVLPESWSSFREAEPSFLRGALAMGCAVGFACAVPLSSLYRLHFHTAAFLFSRLLQLADTCTMLSFTDQIAFSFFPQIFLAVLHNLKLKTFMLKIFGWSVFFFQTSFSLLRYQGYFLSGVGSASLR